MNSKIILVALGCMAAVTLTACSTVTRRVNSGIRANTEATRTLKSREVEQYGQKAPVSVSGADYFGSGKTLALAPTVKLPAVFRKPVTLVTPPLYLFQLTDKISAVAGLPVTMGPILLEQQQQNQHQQTQASLLAREGVQLSIDYHGSLGGLMNTVAGHFGVSWKYSKGSIYIYEYVTKVYALDLLPGVVTNNALVTNRSALGTSGGGSGSTGGATASSSQSVGTNQNNNMWKAVLGTVTTMLTQHGKASINEDAGTITVMDTPATQMRVASYLGQFSKTVDRQVAVVVRIYSLEGKGLSQRGISLSAIFTNLKQEYGITTQAITPVFSLSDAGSLSASVLKTAGTANGALGQWAGSKALANVLDQYGKVSLVTQGSGIAMQGQPLPIQVTTTTGYLASSTSMLSGISSIGSTALTPGQVTTGFALTVTPRIMPDANIIMQYVLDLSTLNNIQTISSGGEEIQVPNVSSRRFIQRVRMHSGSMLVLAGYEQTSNTREHGHGILSWFSKTNRDKTILFVTISANVI